MKGDLFHVCNRGVNKQKIFLEKRDYQRFVESLYKFNNEGGAIRFEGADLFSDLPPQHKTIEILKWTLLPNHFHLLLYELIPGGITDFIKRLGNGYTKYFNTKYERSGYLFQNKAKVVPIQDEGQLRYIPFYVELNSLDLLKEDWRTKGVKDLQESLFFLRQYEWTSFGKQNTDKYAAIANDTLFYELFETNPSQYEKEIAEFIKTPDVNVAR